MDVSGEVNLDGNVAVFGAGVAMTGRSLVSHVISLCSQLSDWFRMICYASLCLPCTITVC